MTRTLAAVVITSVTIAGATAAALFTGGDHAAPPLPIRTPTYGPLVAGYVAQTVTWDKTADATGYRLYLDGLVIALNPASRTSALLATTCGVQHRFNSQPFNNKGFAPLAPPVHFTSPCEGATR